MRSMWLYGETLLVSALFFARMAWRRLEVGPGCRGGVYFLADPLDLPAGGIQLAVVGALLAAFGQCESAPRLS